MSRTRLFGYDKIGSNGNDGIRYAWNMGDSKYILESAAFKSKTKGEESKIAGYTTSVGIGCILRNFGYACKFCRTGKLVPFKAILSAEEIAKQNILMVLTDMNCSVHQELKEKRREFAYMGQGEPGYSYLQLRLAIKITDYVMSKLGQSVHRHIISTSGIMEMLHAIKKDIESNYFDSKITMHFSLHATRNRNDLMPINTLYPYENVIQELEKISKISGEKVCLGVLLFNQFKTNSSSLEHTTNLEELEDVLSIANPKHFRFSFCEYNNSLDVGTSQIFSENEAYKICEYTRSKGYEAKLFSSFGKEEKTACGMLAGKLPEYKISKKWSDLEKYADELISEALICISND